MWGSLWLLITNIKSNLYPWFGFIPQQLQITSFAIKIISPNFYIPSSPRHLTCVKSPRDISVNDWNTVTKKISHWWDIMAQRVNWWAPKKFREAFTFLGLHIQRFATENVTVIENVTDRHVELFKWARMVFLDMHADSVTRVTRLITTCTCAETICNFIKSVEATYRPANRGFPRAQID